MITSKELSTKDQWHHVYYLSLAREERRRIALDFEGKS